AFPVPAFAAPAFAVVAGAAGLPGVVAAVFVVAASGLAGPVVAVGPCAPADGLFASGVTGCCRAKTGTTQAATAASEIRMLVDLVGCMLSLQQEELSNRCSGLIWPAI